MKESSARIVGTPSLVASHSATNHENANVPTALRHSSLRTLKLEAGLSPTMRAPIVGRSKRCQAGSSVFGLRPCHASHIFDSVALRAQL